MRMPFDSEEANELNKRIFETIYFGALEASCEHLWNVVPPTVLWDWIALRAKIV